MKRNAYFIFLLTISSVNMSFVENLFQTLYHGKVLTYRVSDLLISLSNDKSKDKYICISIETDTNTRRFCYLTLDELFNVYQLCPISERCFYELVCSESHVKPYIDFEYYTDYNLDIVHSRIGPITCLKILHLLFDFNMKYNYNQNDDIDFLLEKFLILEA